MEAGLVVSLLLAPLLVGIIQWGDYFWRAQSVDTLAPAVPTGAVAGTFTCEGLKSAVAAQVASVVNGLNPSGSPMTAAAVLVTVTEVLPSVGVTVDIHVEAPTSGLASLIPLPGGGALVTDFSQRLSDVTVSSAVCR
ncbi:hypothetical protein FB382_002404 [Nocardioides ginsengisegetis]|uniref:Uncharacterized protein n=1 Tax=Nocardioides ginsengisegetis TaxID=661491 RepID=A0A7W3J0L6_9ACTN|nr:hypothetical protein [Nocardioides ginsengisegetis]